jgi:hypothetical protein
VDYIIAPLFLSGAILLSFKKKKIMSAGQTLEIYKVLPKYFQNDEDAARIVSDLEKIIDKKLR